MAKKCTKILNARAQLLFCSLNLLFSDVLVAVVACLHLYVQFVTDMCLVCIYKHVPLWPCTSVLFDCMLLMVLVWCLLGDAVLGTALSVGTVAAS